MYGAIIGDLAGSIYEYEQVKKVRKINITNNIIHDNSFFSDDTILTIAILDAILNNRDYNKYIREYINKYANYKPDYKPYFNSIFSPSLIKWSKQNLNGTSCGNGAMMRISSVGYLFNTEKEVIENAREATIPSHNSQQAIFSATQIALIIFYLRNGISKEGVCNKLNIKPKYEPFKKFNSTCSETIDNCLYALFESTSFEDAIKRTISMGGDTDTNACIVGSMAEALYGIDSNLIELANNKLPNEFIKTLRKSKVYNR